MSNAVKNGHITQISSDIFMLVFTFYTWKNWKNLLKIGKSSIFSFVLLVYTALQSQDRIRIRWKISGCGFGKKVRIRLRSQTPVRYRVSAILRWFPIRYPKTVVLRSGRMAAAPSGRILRPYSQTHFETANNWFSCESRVTLIGRIQKKTRTSLSISRFLSSFWVAPLETCGGCQRSDGRQGPECGRFVRRSGQEWEVVGVPPSSNHLQINSFKKSDKFILLSQNLALQNNYGNCCTLLISVKWYRTYHFLCTGAFLYVPYSFLLISNKFCV